MVGVPESLDLIIVGGTPAGLSLAAEAQAAGLERVLVLESSDTVVPADAAGRLRLNVRYQTQVVAIRDEGSAVVVDTLQGALQANAVAYADPLPGTPLSPEYPLPPSLTSRVHFSCDEIPADGCDVLVVGGGEQATGFAESLVEQGHQVVLALLGEFEQLSRLSRETLERMEQERRATILWHSTPDAVGDVGGFPMAYFDDRRTPDLQVDHVVYALGVQVDDTAFEQLGIDVPSSSTRSFILQDRKESVSHPMGSLVPAGRAWDAIRAVRFPSLPATPHAPPAERREELAARYYNATITYFEKAHSDLWLIRVRPDTGSADHRAGQYATLGLGYWEPRIDDAIDRLKEGQVEKLVRRSYSISSPILDAHGYLVNPYESEELEFYVVLVPPSEERVPGLTPRLARKEVGDRIYLGPKISGRYTLDPVTDPASVVVFLATGTGEAPHNAMIAELLRRGHYGPIASVVTVRRWTDLGYRRLHTELERRFSNYHYLALPTREPDVPKRYIQDVVESGELEGRLGASLDPSTTTVFLCGNPAMIGPPTWNGNGPVFPTPRGVVELLVGRGFTPDRREAPGNVHFEEYW